MKNSEWSEKAPGVKPGLPAKMTKEPKPVPCRFGCAEAVYHVEVPGGCVCFPEDREQFLCAWHWQKLEPLVSALARPLCEPG